MPIIENERLSKTVADDIQQKIISSELTVGDRLPTEPKLMEEYGVSRTVIREAAACLVSRASTSAAGTSSSRSEHRSSFFFFRISVHHESGRLAGSAYEGNEERNGKS